jgi:biopolymer transport protein ExbD
LIEANGNISLKGESGDIQLIESDSDVRKLPNLGKRLDLHKSVADTSSQKALVQIRVDGEAVQQRVIDVLNALAGAKITEITFTDINDPDAN